MGELWLSIPDLSRCQIWNQNLRSRCKSQSSPTRWSEVNVRKWPITACLTGTRLRQRYEERRLQPDLTTESFGFPDRVRSHPSVSNSDNFLLPGSGKKIRVGWTKNMRSCCRTAGRGTAAAVQAFEFVGIKETNLLFADRMYHGPVIPHGAA